MGALDAAGAPCALCGALAVAARGYPRFTSDIDLIIRESDLKAALQALEPIGFDLRSGIIPLNVGKPTEGRLFRVNKAEGEDLLTVDLMLATPFLLDVFNSRTRLEVAGGAISVVSRDGLLKMKRAAGRSRDLMDIARLEGAEE